jgi:hypothetical protein
MQPLPNLTPRQFVALILAGIWLVIALINLLHGEWRMVAWALLLTFLCANLVWRLRPQTPARQPD